MPSTASCRNLLISLILLVLAAPLSAVEGEWRMLGPDGGSVYALAVEPGNPQVMYAGVESGAYKSVDGGATWTWAGRGLDSTSQVGSLAVDPVHTSTVYAGQGRGVYKSVDGGQSWARIGPPGLQGIFDIATHPSAPGTVFASAALGLFRTVDGGTVWQRITRRGGLPKQYRARLVLFDPSAPSRLYAVIEDLYTSRVRVYKSTNGGTSWRPANSGLEDPQIFALAIDPQAPQTLYAGTSDAVYKSTDGGASWRRTGLTGIGTVAALVVHPEQSGVVYAGTVAAGVFRSQDDGATWTRLSQGLPEQGNVTVLTFSSPQALFAGVFTWVRRSGVFKSTDEGDSWTLSSRGLSALAVDAVAADPRTPGTLWVVANKVLFKSTNRGETWIRIRPDPAGDALAGKVVVDPRDSSTVYVLLNDGQLRRTRDGGQTWQAAATPPVNNPRDLVIDPQTPSALYAANAGIAKSTDGGTSWTLLPGEPANARFFHLAVSPFSPSILYAVGTTLDGQPRVLRTTDGGATWTRIELGLPAAPFHLAVDPLRPTTVFAILAGLVYKTDDGGDTWSRFSNTFRNQWVHPLAVSPGGLLYVAVGGHNVYESMDGANWSPLGDPFTRSYFAVLAVDPLDSCRIYIGTYRQGLLAFTKTGTAECSGGGR